MDQTLSAKIAKFTSLENLCEYSNLCVIINVHNNVPYSGQGKLTLVSIW